MPSGLRSESRQGSGLLGDQLERPSQYRSKKHGSKQQKHHDIAEPVRAGYFSYLHEIVSAGERAESAPGGNVELKASGSNGGLAGQDDDRDQIQTGEQ